MHDRSAWLRGTPGPKVIKGHEYKNLVEFSRKCQTCEKPFSIFVTAKIAAGHADSNSFGLKNCPEHRRNKTAGEAAEVERLRMENSVMREELAGLYERDAALFAEIQTLKAQLASQASVVNNVWTGNDYALRDQVINTLVDAAAPVNKVGIGAYGFERALLDESNRRKGAMSLNEETFEDALLRVRTDPTLTFPWTKG